MRVSFKTIIFLVMFIIASSCEEQRPNNPNYPDYEPANGYNPDDYKDENSPDIPDESTWLDEAKTLTRDYSNFPSSKKINDYINNATNAPNDPCPKGTIPISLPVKTSSSSNRAAVGARTLLASFYQSCKAIDTALDRSTPNLKGIKSGKKIDGQKGVSGGRLRKITNLNDFVQSHAILKDLKADPNYPGPSCKDMTKQPPVYGYGSRAAPNKKGIVKILKKGGGVTRTSAPASGIDCSAFVNTALGSQGLKINESSGPFTDNTTRSFHKQINRSGSCLEYSEMTPDKTIASGDIINLAGSHVVIIDSIGEDPLAVEKFAATNNCDAINPGDFNFTYIHSGSIKGSYGPSRVKANLHRGGKMWNNLRTIAVKMCKKKVNDDNSPIRTNRINGISSLFSLTRHKTSNPKCVSDKRVKIEGEECINQCKNI